MLRRVVLVGLLMLVVAAPARAQDPFDANAARAVPAAKCGKGSKPETALQGEVPLADRMSGRSAEGYRCNLRMLGHFQGEGATWVSPSYGTCAYEATRWPNNAQSPGVQVIDASDPRHPVRTTTLTSPAMQGPWESLKVNERRGLLAAVFVGPGVATGFFEVYDIRTDCAHPKLLGSITSPLLFAHEGNWSPDGNTYWASGLGDGLVTAIDTSDPTNPHIIFQGSTGTLDHGFGISDDGTRMYMAEIGGIVQSLTGVPDSLLTSAAPNGLQILDISDIQNRRSNPQIHPLGHVYWTDGSTGQHAIPVHYGTHPYVVFVDELGEGGVRIIDTADEANPRIVSRIKLQIMLPQYAAQRVADLKGTGVFGYNSHYCTVDRPQDPTALACGFFNSGVRVFDIRRPRHPRQIAYFNPPAQQGKNAQLQGSEHAGGIVMQGLNLLRNGGEGGPILDLGSATPDLTADWCSSPPRFVGRQLWVTCQDYGFMTLRFTNRAYPLRKRRSG